MLSSDSHDFVHSSRYSVEELRQAIRGGSPRLTPQLALALLARKEYAEKSEDLRRILTDDKIDSRLREVAARELARLGTAESKTPRFQPLTSSLRQTTERPEPELKRFTGLRQLPIKVERLSEGQWERLTRAAAVAGLGEEWSIRQATQFSCAGRRFGLVLHRSVERGPALEKPELAGVVARLEEVESGEWNVRYAIYAERAASEEESISLVVVTDDGQIAYRGLARRAERGYRFEIGTSAGFRKEPIELAGFFRDGALTFDRAMSEAQKPRGETPQLRKR